MNKHQFQKTQELWASYDKRVSNPDLDPVDVYNEQLAEDARARRTALLFDSDWTQIPDVPVSIRDQWTVYRQELRDITAQPGFPRNIDWPAKPE